MHIFKDGTAISRELTQTEDERREQLAKYLESYRLKKEVMQKVIRGGSPFGYLHMLEDTLKDELELLKQAEKDEDEIIADLRYLSHDTYIHHTNRVLAQLMSIKEHDKYVKRVMEDLKGILLNEARKVKRMRKGDRSMEVVEELRSLFMIELQLMEKLSFTEDYRDLFLDIQVAEREESSLAHVKKRFMHGLYKQMTQVIIDDDGKMHSTDGKYISELTAKIFNKLEEVIMDAVTNGKIEQHPHADFDFVNSDLFEEYVRAEIEADARTGKLVPSQNTVGTFVQLFRQLYNSERT